MAAKRRAARPGGTCMRRRPAQSLRCSCLPHHEDFAVRGRVRRVCSAESSSRRDNSARTYAPQAGHQALPRAGCVPDGTKRLCRCHPRARVQLLPRARGRRRRSARATASILTSTLTSYRGSSAHRSVSARGRQRHLIIRCREELGGGRHAIARTCGR